VGSLFSDYGIYERAAYLSHDRFQIDYPPTSIMVAPWGDGFNPPIRDRIESLYDGHPTQQLLQSSTLGTDLHEIIFTIFPRSPTDKRCSVVHDSI